MVGAFGLGLPAAISARIVQNTLYALGEVKGPARVAVARLLVGVVIGFVLMFQLDLLTVEGKNVSGAENLSTFSAYTADKEQDCDVIDCQSHLGAAGLALGAAAAAWTEFVLLRILLKRTLGRRIVTGYFWSILLASVVSGSTMYLVGKVSIVSPVDVVVVLVSGAIVYVGVLWVLGIRPIRKVGFRS